MRQRPRPPSAHLPLPHRFERRVDDADRFRVQLGEVCAGGTAMAAAGDGGRHQSCLLQLEATRVLSAAHGPMRLHLPARGALLLLMHLGSGATRQCGTSRILLPTGSALLLHGQDAELDLPAGETIVLALDAARLREALRGLAGPASATLALRDLVLGGDAPHIGEALRALPRLIAWSGLHAGTSCEQMLLAESLVYRTLARALAQAQGLPVKPRVSRNLQLLVGACTYLIDRLGDPVTMDDLRRHCSSSARTLQMRFTADIGQPPFDWLHEQKLQLAYRLLTAAEARIELTRSVTDVAQRCGIAHLGRFAGEFRRRFGASPSHLLA